MPSDQQSVSSLVKQGYLTAKQGEKLPGSFALKVGMKNKKKKHKPMKSLSTTDWEKKKKAKKGQKGQKGKPTKS